ncbi:MAG: methyltransferase domain-containing protein [Candidatus Omnitrophota bacterium]
MDLIEEAVFTGNRHPWEIARCRSILSLERGGPGTLRYADIGAGDMYFTRALSKSSSLPVYAVDSHYTVQGAVDGIIRVTDIRDLPTGSVDRVFLMDVLEHIEDDARFLGAVADLLGERGSAIITVPAFDYLFSGHDINLRHLRRYGHRGLIGLLEKHGFIIDEYFYFYVSLFFIRFLQVTIRSTTGSPDGISAVSRWKFGERSVITVLITTALRAEFTLSRWFKKAGILIPGLSLYCVCHKKGG